MLVDRLASFAVVTSVAMSAVPTTAFAQGQDGTRAERNAQVIASLLPGRYDNVNQVYFDKRLETDEAQHRQRMHVEIARNPDGDTLSWITRSSDADGDTIAEHRFKASLHPEQDGRTVRMKLHRSVDGGTRPLAGCDLLWSMEASQFRAVRDEGDCDSDLASLPVELQLGEDDLWWSLFEDDRPPIALERARTFSCYIDVPGVGGGRDIPYRRYEIDDIHDKGGEQWVEMDDGSALSVKLTNVRWPMNNLNGIFTRHSFVVYLNERRDGEEREIAYSWTQPDAQRIGINIKTALVNCFMLNNEEIEPFFRDEPRL